MADSLEGSELSLEDLYSARSLLIQVSLFNSHWELGTIFLCVNHLFHCSLNALTKYNTPIPGLPELLLVVDVLDGELLAVHPHQVVEADFGHLGLAARLGLADGAGAELEAA